MLHENLRDHQIIETLFQGHCSTLCQQIRKDTIATQYTAQLESNAQNLLTKNITDYLNFS
jgi:hypothetical protein